MKNLESSLRRISLAALNLWSSLLWTSSYLSASRLALRSWSLWNIFSRTYSGVSKLSWNSLSYILSSASRRAASLAFLSSKLAAYLAFICAILSLTRFFSMRLLVFASQSALCFRFLSPASSVVSCWCFYTSSNMQIFKNNQIWINSKKRRIDNLRILLLYEHKLLHPT